VIATARAAGHNVVAALDDSSERIGSTFEEVKVVGPVLSSLSDLSGTPKVVAIGDNRIRAGIAALVPGPFATIIHPFSWIAPDVEIGEGTVIFAGSVVHPSTRIGRHCVLNTGCSVDHDCRIDDFAQVAPGARLAGSVSLGEGAQVGIGACVIQTVTLGAWSVVGAGAAVVRDIPDGVVAKGVPARY
jgi:sugar O-acyltransferase (sialic acid O-acetyltransferase NeuD family)